MADALRCDGPDCDHSGVSPFLGWWRLESTSLIVTAGQRERLDFCSWQCLGAFVLDQAGDVAELERQIGDIDL